MRLKVTVHDHVAMEVRQTFCHLKKNSKAVETLKKPLTVFKNEPQWLLQRSINPLRPNSDLSQTSHCNIKAVSVSEVMGIENRITQVKFNKYFNSFSPLLL